MFGALYDLVMGKKKKKKKKKLKLNPKNKVSKAILDRKKMLDKIMKEQ